MPRKVELQFNRAAGQLIPDGAPALVAVSGGGDSVALLQLLARYAHGRGLQLTVGHLDHGLRRGAAADRRFVERLAAGLALPCISDRREVAELRRKGESPEEAARRVRREFLRQAARQASAELIVLGHTLDDQAETILMRLVRGAGATALTGMAASGPGPFVRPMLGLEREELRAWLRSRKLEFRDDPSNRDLRFDRNRVRRLALPMLRETLNPQAARHLVKAARRYREDALLVDEMANGAFLACARIDRAGAVVLDAAAVAQAPPALANRVAGLALRKAGADPRRITARHIEALIDLAAGGVRREAHLAGKIVARKSRGSIRLRRED